MSILVVLMMAFALVSSGEAGWFPFCCNDNHGTNSAAQNTAGNLSAKDADRAGHFPTWMPYRCGVASPAYTDYIDARALPCTVGRR